MSWFTDIFSRKNDPVYSCIVFKQSGCSHVDGMLCDFETCDMRKEAEIFELEQQLDIPHNLRYYNSKKDGASK